MPGPIPTNVNVQPGGWVIRGVRYWEQPGSPIVKFMPDGVKVSRKLKVRYTDGHAAAFAFLGFSYRNQDGNTARILPDVFEVDAIPLNFFSDNPKPDSA